MKKNMICLMIACLSLFAYPYKLSAETAFTGNENTRITIPPMSKVMEKKVNEFKKNHPTIFRNDSMTKEEKATVVKKEFGGLLIISTGALLIIILLLILLL